jgi:hypothetical protein
VSSEILTALIHFGTSTFGSFERSKVFSPRSTPYPELQIERHMSLMIDDCDLLQDFDVREFQHSKAFFLQNTLYPELQIECHMSLMIDEL